jgi:hypothetical protein
MTKGHLSGRYPNLQLYEQHEHSSVPSGYPTPHSRIPLMDSLPPTFILALSTRQYCGWIAHSIWPRDNVADWWDGNIWCDINVRLQVGCIVGTTASATMIVRKLAKVMDTRNIVLTSSRNSKLKEKAWEILWCWVYPLVLILLYYVVQPVRYMIYGIIGCLSAYDTSWPSIVLSFMWAPITTLVAASYAGKPSTLISTLRIKLTATQCSCPTVSTATVANSSA